MNKYIIAVLLSSVVLISCKEQKKDEPPAKKQFCLSDTAKKMIDIDSARMLLMEDEIQLSGEVSFDENKVIKVYPNPVSNELIIEIEGNSDKLDFEILNAIGQVVFKGNFIEKTTVHTTNFAPGVYLIKLENGKTFEFKKIIKE